ncbi:phage terminase large subunit family protein [Vreelandella titanicae]|jgi:phage terminase large subunit GpA-like protein|uniref:Phage terminase GpA n=1 Tax=Vreelandella titanicae BH1 TaxID=1204738 RepID=L9U7W1_9GAMM|nr:phage terminase large subunit family protein [Halomonas titanicae]ELY20985.1 Phage terminase GpA [Halomonas titanicae BH1]NVE93028.1 phage terminase large subunit family protein [Halomonas titanicae]|tara:strand:- start:1710 stop:2303 length:594 start_codon:yes stop_codon:yes gene_type:complete
MKFAAERVIDYAGGSGVSVASLASKASPADLDISPTPNDMVSLLNMPLIEMEGVHVVTADVVSVGGLVFVGLRAAHKVRGQCQIEAAAEESPHKLNFHVPCPLCGEEHILKWGGPDTGFGIKWHQGKPETALYLCEHNGCVIEQHEPHDESREHSIKDVVWVCAESLIHLDFADQTEDQARTFHPSLIALLILTPFS